MSGRFLDLYTQSLPVDYVLVASAPGAAMSAIQVARAPGQYQAQATDDISIYQCLATSGSEGHGPKGYCDYGAGKITMAGTRPNQYLVRPAHTATTTVCFQHNAFRAFSFSSNFLGRLLEALSPSARMADFGRLHQGVQTSAHISWLLNRIWVEASTGDVMGRMFSDSGLVMVVTTLLREAGQMKTMTLRGGLSPKQLKTAMALMEAHLAEDLGLEPLAAAVGLSPAHFSRAFRQSTGEPPSRWLLNLRIERAQALMGNPAATLADIALAVGFAAQPQFTTAFRRVTGLTPAAWRRLRIEGRRALADPSQDWLGEASIPAVLAGG
jgi:AraC-like DNA-binding protein